MAKATNWKDAQVYKMFELWGKYGISKSCWLAILRNFIRIV